MSAPWQITNTGAVSAAATVTTSLTAGISQGMAIRCRVFSASLSATTAVSGSMVIRDGATGTGTVIWAEQMTAPSSVQFESVDLRATSGSLTIEFTTGLSTATQTVNANGDYVQIGFPAFAGPPAG